MKRLNRLAHLVLSYVAGLLSGAFLRLSFEIIDSRPVSIGGEALILPLIVLLIYLGWQLGAIWREVRERFR